MNKKAMALLIGLMLGAAAHAQTTASEAWARGTVGAQKASGLFLQLQSAKGGRLVAASSPVAARVEMHEMTMNDGVMQMRQIKAIELPAGQAVALKPGGLHLMLMELKAPLKAGESVALELLIEGADKKRETLALKVPVRALGAAHSPMH